MAKHRKPSNTKKNIQRAATVTTGGVAAMAISATSTTPAIAALMPGTTDEAPMRTQVLPVYRAPVVVEPVAPAPVETFVVEPGDTLAKIATELNTNWQTLYEANREAIGDNPNMIFPGQVYFVGGLPLAQAPVTIEEVAPEVEVLVEQPVETLDAVGVAIISNSAGPVSQRAQAAANRVVGSVRGAALITIGGTRASARDMHGHPSGNALDYMVHSDSALGDAIFQYHMDNWDSLGVDYIIWEQMYYNAPGGKGSGKWMENRGSITQNHYDHPHVNYNP